MKGEEGAGRRAMRRGRRRVRRRVKREKRGRVRKVEDDEDEGRR